MRNKRLKLSVTLLFGIGLTGLQAQESINASGGNTSGSGGSVSYSVGQIVYQTSAGLNGSIAEGIQQSYEISIITGTEKVKNINLSISAYPNPVSNYLTLSIEDGTLSNYSFQMYNMGGQLLQSKRITDNQTNIPMSIYTPATYFIKVILNNKEVKIFKIIKK